MDATIKHTNLSPEAKANFLSKWFFCWSFPILRKGLKKDLDEKDLYNTTPADESQGLGDTLERHWNEELKKHESTKTRPSLTNALFKTFWKSYGFYGAIILFQCICLRLTHPLVLEELIKYFQQASERSKGEGLLLAFGVVALSFLNISVMHQANLGCFRVGMRCRIACCSLMYRKLLRLSRLSLNKTDAGHVVNLMSNDVQRFEMVGIFLHYIWVTPILSTCIAGVMYDKVGFPAVIGVIFIAIQAVPLQGYLSKLQGSYRAKVAVATDNRVKLMSEITAGIQIIKMYAWEKPFDKFVRLARKLEIDIITKKSYILGFMTALMVFTERTSLYIMVVSFVLSGHRLTSNLVFSMAQFFNIVQLYLSIFFPLAVASYAEARVSIKRIEDFLSLPENVKAVLMDDSGDTKGDVNIMKAKASWIPNPIIDTLSNINLRLKKGTLCAVVGPVGSGKSSLLQLLLREMPMNSGKVEVNGTVSYASQEPWLFVSTVRNNILFGQEYLRKRYREVTHVCALKTDFEQFPHSDKTLVGERGVSLSGGQRARINLARCVYRSADVYLFDDPLSAVDTHVSKHLFEECIVRYLKGKTRILVTHQLQFLKGVDVIIIMNNGQIEKIGKFEELSRDLEQLQKGAGTTQAAAATDEEEKDGDTQKPPQRKRLMSIVSETAVLGGDFGLVISQSLILTGMLQYGMRQTTEVANNMRSVERKINFNYLRLIKAASTKGDDDDLNEPAETQELMEKGSIPTSTYLQYFTAGTSIFMLCLLTILILLAQAVCNCGDLWLKHWTNQEELQCEFQQAILNSTSLKQNGTDLLTTLNPETPIISDALTANDNETMKSLPCIVDEIDRNTYIYVYTVLIVLTMILTTVRSLMFYKVCMNSSKALHNTMFSNILQATMRFFNTNPSGRILNRFSKDIGAIDEFLPRVFLDSIQIFMVMIGILIMVFIVSPLMIIPAVLLGVMFMLCRYVYMSSAQNLKRLEGTTRAPVFSHVSASLSGLTTIRSSAAEAMVAREFDVLQDQHTSSFFLVIFLSETFGFYLDVISVAFLAVVTFQFFLFEGVLGGDVGLVISQSLILTGMLQYGMRQTTEVANNMTSVERVLQYTKLDKEGPFESSPTKKPHRDWPQKGTVHFKNLYLQYVPSDPPVLKNLNLKIHPGEKVGIVGRTGAGKSSLISAIFRLAPTEGAVIIDDVNTKDIGLVDLRSNISIIPQEPVLFSTTVRNNLDPFDKCNDETLWKALENVELKESVDKLEQEVSEGGSNFSAGQRQLVCLARAIIRNNRIIILDEATANVDQQTDSLIQKTIRANFKECTVLTIAHRLNTVMDSDKVMVMEGGELVEFGHPYELLQQDSGKFKAMLEQTGDHMYKTLSNVAKEAFITKKVREESEEFEEIDLEMGMEEEIMTIMKEEIDQVNVAKAKRKTEEINENLKTVQEGDNETVAIKPESDVISLNKDVKSTVEETKRANQNMLKNESKKVKVNGESGEEIIAGQISKAENENKAQDANSITT